MFRENKLHSSSASQTFLYDFHGFQVLQNTQQNGRIIFDKIKKDLGEKCVGEIEVVPL
jgi:hypothetical protein